MPWTLLAQEKDGHKLFRDEASGRIAIADQSGHYPNETDDGVLWLVPPASITIDLRYTGESHSSLQAWVSIAVEHHTKKGTGVILSPSLAIWYGRHLGIPVEVRTTFGIFTLTA